MAIPDYADERSYHRFRKGLVGNSHGDNGSAYKISWDSECDAEPTKMIQTYGLPVCAYCGNQGLPLQPHISSHRDYDVIGYTCVCKGAMDEEEWKQEVSDMENKHYEEMQAMKRFEPKTNPDVIKALVSKLTQKMGEVTTMHEVNHILQQLKDIGEE